MRRRRWLFILVLLTRPSLTAAQTWVAPFYSLPADGTWVEYDWRHTGAKDQQLTGMLRISSVGVKQIEGAPHRWIEIKLETAQTGKHKRELRKLLVAENAMRAGRPLIESVVACYDKDNATAKVTLLAGKRTHDFLSLGVRGETATLHEEQGKAELQTKLGKFLARQVSAQGNLENRTLQYRGWLTDQAPFGWAKFEIKELSDRAAPRLVFTATVAKRGQDAKSELDETQAK